MQGELDVYGVHVLVCTCGMYQTYMHARVYGVYQSVMCVRVNVYVVYVYMYMCVCVYVHVFGTGGCVPDGCMCVNVYISIHIHTHPYISIHIHTYPYMPTYHSGHMVWFALISVCHQHIPTHGCVPCACICASVTRTNVPVAYSVPVCQFPCARVVLPSPRRMYMYTYVHVCIYVYRRICRHVCLYGCLCVCVPGTKRIHVSVPMYVYVCFGVTYQCVRVIITHTTRGHRDTGTLLVQASHPFRWDVWRDIILCSFIRYRSFSEMVIMTSAPSRRSLKIKPAPRHAFVGKSDGFVPGNLRVMNVTMSGDFLADWPTLRPTERRSALFTCERV